MNQVRAVHVLLRLVRSRLAGEETNAEKSCLII